MQKHFYSKILSLFIILLPFAVWKSYYEGPKVFLFLILGFGLIIFWIYRVLKHKQNLQFNRIDFFYLSWVGVLLVSSIFGVHPMESVTGGSYRHQGVLFFFSLWIIYKSVQIFDKAEKTFLFRGIAFAVLAESVIVFLQYSTGHLYFGKPLGTLGESNAVAGFLGIGSYFVFQYLEPELYALPVVSILIAESRSGLLAIFPNLLFIIKNLSLKMKKILTVLVLLTGLAALVLISLKRVRSPFENRPLIWRLGVMQIAARPILGFGAESGEVVYNSAFKKIHLPLDGLIIDRAHNLPLDIAMWSGVVGLALFSGFVVEFYKSFKDKYKKLALISFLIYSMFQPLSVVHYLLLFLL